MNDIKNNMHITKYQLKYVIKYIWQQSSQYVYTELFPTLPKKCLAYVKLIVLTLVKLGNIC